MGSSIVVKRFVACVVLWDRAGRGWEQVLAHAPTWIMEVLTRTPHNYSLVMDYNETETMNGL